MPSRLAWLDHDSESLNRTKRILALFNERESRDELGLGAIRDAFSDLLFPGTSTIHTRLRYVLIVPWVYRHVESQGSVADLPRRVEQLERRLIEVLQASSSTSEKEWGVFGGSAGTALKRLPSEVYWGVLGWWGIRLHETSRDRYGRDLDVLLGYRKALERRAMQALENQDDTDLARFHFWHPGLPEPPDGFPEVLDIRMRAEESRFLQDRIRITQPGSLLAHLVLHGGPVEVDYPWMHPEYGSFQEEHKRLLELGRVFATVMHGASILYNVLLAELLKREELAGKRREEFIAWEEEIRAEAWRVRSWVGNPHALWTVVDGQDHVVTPMTRAFVERWSELVVTATGSLLDSATARSLVRDREVQRKKGQSRFTNARLLEQWGGSSGMDRLDYRWANVQALLGDLYDGLARQEDAVDRQPLRGTRASAGEP